MSIIFKIRSMENNNNKAKQSKSRIPWFWQTIAFAVQVIEQFLKNTKPVFKGYFYAGNTQHI